MGTRVFLVTDEPGRRSAIDVTNCDSAELLAKIDALLGRVSRPAVFHFGNVTVDFERKHVRKDGAPVAVTAKEIELLRYLVERRETVVPREDILRGVWQYQPGVSSRTIDTHIAWLRQKLEDAPRNPRHIRTVRGVGYRFSA